ncbi:hypothetical protein CRI94_11755 [Longibacter salinarum]|uniref:Uncharacterized protein n=1 Tax=Longibacter salinarum TaxID=1850348 RepID=A0A2A8CXC8_9BACT|nr:hypothetical protein [Longibacter salinarum]PEN13306.1 hypothetical protein CRI94_11755 [Longibacter salinarum]
MSISTSTQTRPPEHARSTTPDERSDGTATTDPYEAALHDPVTYWAFNFFAASIAASILMALWYALGFAVA